MQVDMAIGSTSSSTGPMNDQAQASTSHSTVRQPHKFIEIAEDDEYGHLNGRASTPSLLVLPTSPIELTDVDKSDSEVSDRSFDDAMSISCSDEGAYTYHSEPISFTSLP